MVVSNESIFSQLKHFLSFRCRRLYSTFYYSQYTGKFALIFLFPGALSAIRYRAETKFGYHVFITDDAIQPVSSIPKWLPNKIVNLRKWQNGSRLYFNETTTVTELKEKIYGDQERIPPDVAVGCKGRIFEDSDNLAQAVRSFCKNDPKLLLWREDWKQQLINLTSS